jgi:ribonuclease HI
MINKFFTTNVTKANKKSNLTKIYPYCDYVLFFECENKGNSGNIISKCVIYKNDEKIWSHNRYFVDNCINCVAEYYALNMGMEYSLTLNIKHLIVYGDSSLVINQMNNKYKLKHENLFYYHKNASILKDKFEYIEFRHI